MKAKDLYRKFMEEIRIAVVSDELRRKVSFYLLSGALSLTSFVMTVVNFFTAENVLLFATLIFSVLCLINILVLYFTKVPEIIVYDTFGVEAMALLAFFFISGIPDGFSAFWICLIPSFALLIFGTKRGSVFCLFAMGLLVFLFWLPVGRSMLMYSYNETFMLRFPFLYISVYLISLLIECVRKETQKQLEETRNQYHSLYRHDALTGLYNRYGINEYLEKAFADKSNQHVSIILLDIDDFKNINDEYGHEGGDEVLKMVASIPPKFMCKHCHCSRWGGEEFLLIMQCEHDAVYAAEKIRREIEQTPVLYDGKEIHATVSVGVCIADDLSDVTVHDVIDQADKAMYISKMNGKNRVTTRTIKRAE